MKASHFKGFDKTQPTVIFGGPPCQGFSTSNQKNRDLLNTNNWLYMEYVRLVKEVRPDWVVFENVGSSDIPMGSLNRIQIKTAAMKIDSDLEMVTVPESTGTFLYSCNL